MNATDERTTLNVPIGRQLSRLLDLMISCRHSMLLNGPTGIGKSTFFRDEAKRRGIEVVVLNLSVFESPGELLGLPYIDGGVTRYARPSFFPTAKRGLLVLEELSRAPSFLIAPMYELLTSRRIGEYVLPPGWIIVANANPATADYHTNELDLAMRARFFWIEACVDRDEWRHWAEAAGVHPAILAVAKHEPKTFKLVSPRQWAHLSEELVGAERIGFGPREIELVLTSRLGSVAGAQAVMKYLDKEYAERSYDALDILSRYAHDERLVQLVRIEKMQGRTDLIEALASGAEEILAGDRLGVLVETGGFDLPSFEGFLDELPGDRRKALQIAFGRNPASGQTLGIAPEEAFVGYRKSPLARDVKRWLEDGMHHRIDALMFRLRDHAEELALRGNLERVLRDRNVRKNLLHLVEQVGPERAGPFGAVLEPFGFGLQEAG